MTLLVRSLLVESTPEVRISARRIPGGTAPSDLAERLERFERRFVRKLGDAPPVVRIHSTDYTRQYRSIGPSVCLAACTGDGYITGTLCLALTRLRLPSGIVRRVVFGTNLQVVPEARQGPTLARLMGAAFRWTIPRASGAFAHVPEGSAANPERFTRRLGVPAFSELGAIRLVSFRSDGADPGCAGEIVVSTEREVRAMHKRFMKKFIAAAGGDPSVRSRRTPVWVALRDGSACACIEDYENAKRHELVESRGELIMNHISFFGYRDLTAAAQLIRGAMALSARQEVPLVQLCIDESLESALLDAVGIRPEFCFRARLAGFVVGGLPRAPWSINSSEI